MTTLYEQHAPEAAGVGGEEDAEEQSPEQDEQRAGAGADARGAPGGHPLLNLLDMAQDGADDPDVLNGRLVQAALRSSGRAGTPCPATSSSRNASIDSWRSPGWSARACWTASVTSRDKPGRPSDNGVLRGAAVTSGAV